MIWKSVVGYEGLYEVNTDGELRTFNWKGTGQTRIMKPAKDHKGYLRTMIGKDGKYKTIKMHRIVAEAFIPNPENKPTVNHKNGIKDDNRVDNLEWHTYKENTHHAIENGMFYFRPKSDLNGLSRCKGQQKHNTKFRNEDIISIRARFVPYKVTREDLAKEYGVSPATIKDIVTRRSWKHL
jgi:hypothetical protein